MDPTPACCRRRLPTTQTLAWLVVVLGLTGCGGAEPAWHDGSGYRWRHLAPAGGRPAGFTPLPASRTGIDFVNTVTEERVIHNRHLAHGSGVALGDADGDGLVDVYLARLDGPNALYRNSGGWRFEDVTAIAGVAGADRASTGAVFADVDGDDDLDLLVTALGGPNALYLNDGTGRFRDVTTEAGLASHSGSTTMAVADVDGDGDLDLYLANYKTATATDLFSPQELRFDEVVERVGEEYVVAPKFREHYRLVEVDGRIARVERAEPDKLYLNDGKGRFVEAAFPSGRFLNEDGSPLDAPPEEWALTARFHDVDDDGDPDLFVCNDFHTPDRLWINDGTGTFRAAPRLALRSTSHATMAVDFSDIDRDGDVDVFTVDMLSRDLRRRKMQHPTDAPLPRRVGVIDDRLQRQRNSLFVNRGDGTFAQVAYFAGVAASEWSWATAFVDVDLDGYEDILVATGHLWDVMDFDTQNRVLRNAMGAWRRQLLRFPPLRIPNVAFRNNGDLTFEDASVAWGFSFEDDISHGMATADLDGDGDLDVIINRLRMPAAVLRNDAPAHRIAVRLRGSAPNTRGVGAKITVWGGPVAEQTKEVTVGGMYLSGSDPSYAFATGEAATVTIRVDWRGRRGGSGGRGGRSVVRNVPVDRLYEVYEPPPPARSPAQQVPREGGNGTPTFFADVSAQLGHRHIDSEYDDLVRQPLMPNRLSRLGPGVSWYDMDADGDEDLLIGAGRGGRLAYYRNEGRGWRPVTLSMPVTDYDQTTVLAVPGPAGSTDLLVGQSIYETSSPAEALAVPSVLRLRVESRPAGAPMLTPVVSAAVSGEKASVGPMAVADYDGDGDLDLFVGGRVVPTAYPFAATSRLFRSGPEGEGFTLDGANQAAVAEAGMVSGAVFTDVDSDGDPDLALAVEWGPVKLYRNDGGRFEEVGDAAGLGGYRSRWNGVTAGDFDGDGRMDLVATSWGRNTSYRVTADSPVWLYYEDFDNNGTLDLVEAQYNPRVHGVTPFMSLTRMTAAIPVVRQHMRSFADYASATIEDVFGAGVRRVRRSSVTTLDHMVFLNRGERFEAVPLPAVAQWAPAFSVGVADFDGDGADDLFLSQNFFATHLDAPRYDAGLGLWLRGGGDGSFVAVPGRATGVRVFGEQRGAALADFNQDGRVDLAVSQNGAATKLYVNRGAAPGLRVRLAGHPANPAGIGAVVRVVYAQGSGPAREIHAGSGYWSQDGAVQVLGLSGTPVAVWVRWPGGQETQVPVASAAAVVTIRQGGAAGPGRGG